MRVYIAVAVGNSVSVKSNGGKKRERVREKVRGEERGRESHAAARENMKNANTRNVKSLARAGEKEGDKEREKANGRFSASGITCLFFLSPSPSPSITSCCTRRKIAGCRVPQYSYPQLSPP